MNKKLFEAIIVVLFVLIGTFFVYNQLKLVDSFWDSQFLWNIGMMICWAVVSIGYFNQGWLVYSRDDAQGVSIILPIAVFAVQCILFVKGIYYTDWALIAGALLVNSGVTFSLYQIAKHRRAFRLLSEGSRGQKK
ncbi:MAG: hypothetical protein WD607_01150 [Candidatus Paceibacterota bacterium]